MKNESHKYKVVLYILPTVFGTLPYLSPTHSTDVMKIKSSFC